MSNSRKTWLVVFMVACLAVALAVPAYATIKDASYKTWGSVSTLPGNTSSPNPNSPHGGYTTTTVKCAVCHAVHNANAIGEILLPSTVSQACNFCHVSLSSSYTQVYGSNTLNYMPPANQLDFANAHNYWTVAGSPRGVQCGDCHEVHAAQSAMTNSVYLTQKLLSGSTTVTGQYDAAILTAPSDTGASDPATQTSVSKWCTKCHPTGLGGTYNYYGSTYNLTSHVMTAAATVYDNSQATFSGQAAWSASNYCQSCHTSQFGTAAWPHYTAGNRFLVVSANASQASVPATNTEADGVCLRCHRSGTGTSGIGLTF